MWTLLNFHFLEGKNKYWCRTSHLCHSMILGDLLVKTETATQTKGQMSTNGEYNRRKRTTSLQYMFLNYLIFWKEVNFDLHFLLKNISFNWEPSMNKKFIQINMKKGKSTPWGKMACWKRGETDPSWYKIMNWTEHGKQEGKWDWKDPGRTMKRH